MCSGKRQRTRRGLSPTRLERPPKQHLTRRSVHTERTRDLSDRSPLPSLTAPPGSVCFNSNHLPLHRGVSTHGWNTRKR